MFKMNKYKNKYLNQRINYKIQKMRKPIKKYNVCKQTKQIENRCKHMYWTYLEQ